MWSAIIAALSAVFALITGRRQDKDIQAGKDAQKVDDLQQQQKDTLDAKTERDAADNASRADNVKWMRDNGFIKD